MKMTTRFFACAFGLLAAIAAASGKDLLHPDSTGAEGCPPGASADYQPGSDPVAPADLTPPMTIDLGKTTIVEPYLASSNPAINQTRLDVRVTGLNDAIHPGCIPTANSADMDPLRSPKN